MNARLFLVLFISSMLGTFAGPPAAPPPPRRAAPAPLVERARQAVTAHLVAVHAPRGACVLEAGPGPAGDVSVTVWWPGEDQPTRLPRLITFSYRPASGLVPPE